MTQSTLLWRVLVVLLSFFLELGLIRFMHSANGFTGVICEVVTLTTSCIDIIEPKCTMQKLSRPRNIWRRCIIAAIKLILPSLDCYHFPMLISYAGEPLGSRGRWHRIFSTVVERARYHNTCGFVLYFDSQNYQPECFSGGNFWPLFETAKTQ